MSISTNDYFLLKSQLAEEQKRDFSTRSHQNRLLAQSQQLESASPIRQLMFWSKNQPQPNQHDIGTYRDTGHFLISVFGLLIGITTTIALFNYNGSRPINIIHIIAVMVLLQSFFLSLFFISLIPNRILRFIPGFKSLLGFLSGLSPAKWIQSIVNWLQERRIIRQHMSNAISDLSLSHKNWQVDHRITRWQFNLWSQMFGLSFNAAAIITALCLVSFSDLAFGWSTTLELASSHLKSITDMLAMPWQQWSHGVPTLELINETQYFRASGQLIDSTIAGQWWPFIIASLCTYGLLPRIITVIISTRQYRSALKQSILDIPGADFVIRDMREPHIDTQAQTNPIENLTVGDHAVEVRELPWKKIPVYDALCHWGEPALHSDVFINTLNHYSGLSVIGIEDQQIDMDTINEHLIAADKKASSKKQILLLVKSWEPPLLSLIDLIKAVQKEHGATFIILPYDIKQDQLSAAKERDINTWQGFLRKHHDLASLIHIKGNE